MHVRSFAIGLTLAALLMPAAALAYITPDQLFDMPLEGDELIPDLGDFSSSSTTSSSSSLSSSSSTSSSSSSSSSTSSATTTSSSSRSSVFLGGPNGNAPDPNNALNHPNPRITNDHGAAPLPYPPVVTVRPDNTSKDLSNTGPGDIAAIALFAGSALYTLRRAYKLDKVTI